MPRVILDGHFFGTPWTGVAYYAYGLINALAEDRRAGSLTVSEGMRHADAAEWASSYRDGRRPPEGASATPPLHRLVHRIPVLRGLARRTRSLLHRLPAARARCDLFHALNYVPITTVDAPILPVVHDMSCITNPGDHPAERVRFFESELVKVQSAPAIHTVSHFSKGEIVRLLGVAPDRVHVISPGADWQCLSAPLAPGGSAPPLGLAGGRYIAAVATLEPRKNLRTLVAAQLALPPAIAKRQPVVIAGAKGWGDPQWPAGFEAAVADGRIIPAGYLDRATLIDLKRHARAVAYPSIYEGFGLPVLEALACGTDVLIAKGTSCEEAGRGQAIALPGLDADAWAEALRRLAETPIEHQRRVELRRAAMAGPTWRDAAAASFTLYEAVLGRPFEESPPAHSPRSTQGWTAATSTAPIA